MKELPYQRVDIRQLAEGEDAPAAGSASSPPVAASGVRWWIIPLSILLCLTQAAMTILGDQIFSAILTSTLIPVISFGVLFILLLVINPACVGIEKLRRRGHPSAAGAASGPRPSKRLNRIELICIFTAMIVSSSLSTFGLAAHVVPLIPGPWNPEWNTPQRGMQEHLTHPDDPLLNPRMYLQDANVIRGFREGLPIDPPAVDATLTDHISYYRTVITAIPWRAWAGPLFYWMIFLFGVIGIFYSLAFMMLRFWSEREKLIFPLAQLTESVLPDDHDPRAFPKIFYRPGFWAGFAVSFLILSWNAMIAAGWVIQDFMIPLGMNAMDTAAMIQGSWIEGLSRSLRFQILFTGIGIAFLLPKQISFSTWFYFMVAQVMLLIAVWAGFGQSLADFPANFRSTANFLSAQGGGALLAFAAISFFRILREYYELSIGKSSFQRIRLMMPVIWLVICLAVVVLWLLWNQISLLWALLFVIFFSLFTIGLMRIVAETGIYYFQANFGFFHAFNVLGLGKWVSGAAIAPLFPMYSIFFADIKAFIAPNIINAGKLQLNCNKGRGIFHANMLLCILLSALFSVGFMIFVAYTNGAQQMNNWFMTSMPVGTLTYTQSLIDDTVQGFSANGVWMLVGIAWLSLSLWLRQSWFWFPHPIGYILLFNPLLATLWLSFFIGWILKSVTIKYGGKSSFELLKPILIGLIFGELLAILIWVLAGAALGFTPGITLNRT